jgi:hypothetical protein
MEGSNFLCSIVGLYLDGKGDSHKNVLTKTYTFICYAKDEEGAAIEVRKRKADGFFADADYYAFHISVIRMEIKVTIDGSEENTDILDSPIIG